MTPSSSVGMAVSWRASWSVAWLLALREWLSGYRASRWNALWPLLYPVLYTALLLAVRPLLGQQAHDPARYALFAFVGFSLWQGADGETYVTFPSRAFGAGSERRYFDFLRSTSGEGGDVKRVKAWILDAYKARQAAAA